MVKQFWPLFFVLVFFSSLWSQEVKRAPTMEHCRTDQRLWLPKLESNRSSISFKELMSWDNEMGFLAMSLMDKSSRLSKSTSYFLDGPCDVIR